MCDEHGAVYIADSVQCGYGRSGKFFSHDFAGANADIYTMAKGMGNGFPVAGLIIAPHIKAKHFQLGTTFGGNHLACAAALAVLEVIEEEKLMGNAVTTGHYLQEELKKIPALENVRGKGLMIGFDVPEEHFPNSNCENTNKGDELCLTGKRSISNFFPKLQDPIPV